MHPRLAELVEYSQAQRKDLLSAVAMIPERLRGWRADRTEWSVAEVLEHLHRVESGIVRLLTRGVQRAHAAGAEPERETGSLLSSLDSFRIESRSTVVRAPEPVMPRGDVSATQALAALEESRRDLMTAAAAGNGLALGTITYPHPLLGTLNLYQWILFVGQHEARHAEQIREIAQRLAGVADGPRRLE